MEVGLLVVKGWVLYSKGLLTPLDLYSIVVRELVEFLYSVVEYNHNRGPGGAHGGDRYHALRSI